MRYRWGMYDFDGKNFWPTLARFGLSWYINKRRKRCGSRCDVQRGAWAVEEEVESTDVFRSSNAKPLESPPRQNLRGSIRELEFPKGTLKSPKKDL